MSNKGKLVIILGPSGCGKGTIISELFKLHPEFVFSVSATTRSPRPGEVDGVHYHFITHECFEDMIVNDGFLEHAQYVGEFYGTPSAPVDKWIDEGKTVFLEVDIQGAEQVVSKRSDAIAIFIVPPNLAELERRLRGRKTESEEKITERIKRAKVELEEKDKFDYIVVNDTVSRATNEILDILVSAHN